MAGWRPQIFIQSCFLNCKKFSLSLSKPTFSDLFDYLTVELSPDAEFYPQKAPFPYPFEVSSDVSNQGLDLEKLTTENPSDALNFVASLFGAYSFGPTLFMYQYTFPVHPNWAILPHPFIKSIQAPKKWVEHFKQELKADEGINGLNFHQELDLITKTKGIQTMCLS